MQTLSGMTAALLLATVLSGCVAVPARQDAKFVGEGTNELATALLQGHVDSDSNLAFSPFGISALLAIMAEGAHGETRNQLATALHLPDDREYTREAYHSILQRLNEKNPTNQPEFRNWFYIYKNFSVEPEYKEILRNNYLTEVKDIERDWVAEDEEENGTQPPKEEKEEEIKEPVEAEHGIPEGMEEEKPQDPVKENPEEIMETSDRAQQTEDKTSSLEGNAKEPEKDAGHDEHMHQEEDKPAEKPVQLCTTHKKVKARENQDLSDVKEITSGLSGNNFVASANKYSSKRKSLMIVFNGLYFKGIWKQPFKLSDEETSFYKSDTEKRNVKMMHAAGAFLYGSLQELDSVALQLPYKGERYSLLVVMPNSRSGLRGLTEELIDYPLSKLRKNLEMQEVEVCLPSFEIQTTTKSIDSLRKFGVSHVFDPEKADLSGVSKETSGLFVEELVQLVTVKVDESSGSFNELTAATPSLRSGAQKFVADHPFLYFVLDNVDNLVIVAGKVVDPTHIPPAP